MYKNITVFFKNKTICFEFHNNENKTYIDSYDINSIFNNFSDTIIYRSPFPERLFSQFISYFNIIEAAGGIVVNEHNEWVMIHRFGYWDLPKGKIDKGENAFETAIREVSEECNVNVSSNNAVFIDITYHIYEQNNTKIIKRTYWYLFFVNKYNRLIPQIFENIEKVEWVNKEKWLTIKNNTYPSIIHLIQQTSLICYNFENFNINLQKNNEANCIIENS